VILGWFVVIGVVGALVWWKVTPLAEFTRTTTSGQMDEAELGRRVAADGWYFVVAAVGGVVSGFVLALVRRRDPLVTVVLVAVGAALAAGLMLWVGEWLGPPNPRTALLHAAVGDKVPLQLKTHAAGVALVWPIAAMLGAVGVIWGVDERRPRDLADQ
jgi:hypothetical protein